MMVLSRSSVLILGQLIVLYTFRCSDCLTETKNVFKSIQARYDFSDRNDNNTGFRPNLWLKIGSHFSIFVSALAAQVLSVFSRLGK